MGRLGITAQQTKTQNSVMLTTKMAQMLIQTVPS